MIETVIEVQESALDTIQAGFSGHGFTVAVTGTEGELRLFTPEFVDVRFVEKPFYK